MLTQYCLLPRAPPPTKKRHHGDCDWYIAASQTSSDTTASAVDEAAAEEKPAKKSKKGKKVQWPTDDANLAIFHFFEMDEDERGRFAMPSLNVFCF